MSEFSNTRNSPSQPEDYCVLHPEYPDSGARCVPKPKGWVAEEDPHPPGKAASEADAEAEIRSAEADSENECESKQFDHEA